MPEKCTAKCCHPEVAGPACSLAITSQIKHSLIFFNLDLLTFVFQIIFLSFNLTLTHHVFTFNPISYIYFNSLFPCVYVKKFSVSQQIIFILLLRKSISFFLP